MSKKKQKKSGDTIAEKTTVPIKQEHDGDATREHLHHFTVKFPPDNKKYTVTCDEPGTVRRALQSSRRYQELQSSSISKELKAKDENLVIQLGKADKEIIIATHFPCCCISEDKSLLLITSETKKVEAAQLQPNTMVDSSDEYSVFYIETVGGLNTKSKPLFLNRALKKFKYLCVYGEKGTTVRDALQRDGRFIDFLDNFKLSDNKNQHLTECSQRVDLLNGKKFKICLPRDKRDKTKGASDSHRRDKSDARVRASKSNGDTTAVLAVVTQRATSVATVLANSVNVDEVYEKLRNQFPHLKKLMESRFPGDSYQTALELRKENFVKIQKSFSEVHRVRELVKLGESVCKVVVEGFGQGTGFVLFGNFILTNAHLFKGCVEEGRLKSDTKVYVLFNDEDPEPHRKYICYPVNVELCRYNPGELDYAILEIDPEGLITFQGPTPTQQIKVPPGLLKVFGPMPSDGEACIVGHPAGSVKQMDPTCIIEKEQRQQTVDDQLRPYSDTLFTVISLTHILEGQGINNVMMGGKRADEVVTYNTFMYHGASGSPVFDARCRVFGLHTAGFVVSGFPKQHLLEFAQPLLTIFKDFVRWLKEHREDDMLERVKEAAKGNSDLQKVLNATDTESPTVKDEPIE